MKTSLLALWVLSLGTPLACLAQNATYLFNGTDLNGWTQRGGNARFSVENNEVVGTSVANTPNSFLTTDKDYADFILEYEFKIDPRLNSGVQIRSHAYNAATSVDWEGKTIAIPAGRVHGYQIEIDPSARSWTAGIYDEARRGWLFPHGEQKTAYTNHVQTLYKPGDWNHVRIEARGASLKTWLNGSPCAAIVDATALRGFIGLQVHSINDASLAGAQVRWRDIKITELTQTNTLSPEEEAAGWKLLWDGKTPAGWRSPRSENFPSRGWEIKDGTLSVLRSGGAESAAGGDIITHDQYAEFELTLEFRITPGANSGIKYLVQPNLDPITGTGARAQVGSAIGLEYQILDDERHPDAKGGRDGNRTVASLYDLQTAATTKRPAPMGEWNQARLVVKGSRVEHWLNGQQVLHYDRSSATFADLVKRSKYHTIPGFGLWPSGHILLQDHGDDVSFRTIKIRPL